MVENYDEDGHKYIVVDLIEGRPFENIIWNGIKEKGFNVPIGSKKKTLNLYNFSEIMINPLVCI